MKLSQTLEPELKVQMELDAHEKESAIKYQMMNDKLDGLDKRMWRLEAMVMVSTVAVMGMVATVVAGIL